MIRQMRIFLVGSTSTFSIQTTWIFCNRLDYIFYDSLHFQLINFFPAFLYIFITLSCFAWSPLVDRQMAKHACKKSPCWYGWFSHVALLKKWRHNDMTQVTFCLQSKVCRIVWVHSNWGIKVTTYSAWDKIK